MGDLGANRNWWQSHNADLLGCPQFRTEPTTCQSGPREIRDRRIGNAARARGVG